MAKASVAGAFFLMRRKKRLSDGTREMENQNPELVLSADFELRDVHDLLGPDVLKAHPELETQYAVVDLFQETTYLVNQSIYYFLKLFSTPVPLEQVYAELGTSTASGGQVARFVKDLREKEILVTPARNSVILDHIAKETEAAPEPDLGARHVLKALKHTRHVWIGLVSDETRPVPYVLKKILLPPDLSSKERERRIRDFAHEAAMHQAAGSHPNIVALYGADMEKHEMMLAYVEGKSIRKFVKNHNPPLRDQCRLISKILAVFTHLHANGVLHGDIHSSNFLVTPQQEPMLFDFDMARRHDTKGARAAKIGGVYPYAPPERISTAPMEIFNKTQTSHFAEVYQLGIIFYLILHHELPFEGATWKDLSGRILSLAPVWKEKTPAGEDIPETVSDVLRKALEKNPAARYAGVQDFASAWERAVKDL